LLETIAHGENGEQRKNNNFFEAKDDTSSAPRVTAPVRLDPEIKRAKSEEVWGCAEKVQKLFA
jgi:hypothetical protein